MKSLLVEDNPADVRLIREMLKESPVETFQLEHVARLDSALKRLRQEHFDVVLLDLGLPDAQGMQALTLIQAANGALPIIVLTGLDDENFAFQAVSAGAQDYLVKGRFNGELLVRTIRYAVQRKQAEEEIRRVNAELERRVVERTVQLQTANDELRREIVERTRAEQELIVAKELAEKTLAQFRANIDSMSEGMYVIDTGGERRLTNPAYFRIHGFDPIPSQEFAASISTLLERYDLNGRLLSPEEWPVSRALRGETVLHSQQRVRRIDTGHEATLSVNAIPVRNAAGKVTQAVVTIRDITERIRSEEALRQSEERWATTLRSIGDAVISTCAQGKVIFMNEVAEKLTGWPLSEAQGRDLEEVFNIVNEVTRIKPENPVAKVIRLGQVVGLANHTALISRNGTEIPIEDSGAPIRDKDGKVTGVVLVFHDIREKRRAEKAVRDSERLAMTGRLASTLAHEIHNPLDTVGNLLYLIDLNRDVPEIVRQARFDGEGRIGSGHANDPAHAFLPARGKESGADQDRGSSRQRDRALREKD